MALLLQHQEANQLRGNLSAFFVFSSIISLMVQWPTGFLTWHHVLLTLPLIPAAWLGYVLARKTTHSLPKEKIRFAALALCLVSGATAVWHGFF
ncbi:permease [Vibrio cholerae]|nr:permease [Vibrio cholerae]